MKVRLYQGSLKLVEKSGVGRAVHHQEAMLEAAGADVCKGRDRDADIVSINTVFPDSVAAAVAAKLRGQKVIYYGHSTMEDFRRSFKCSDLLAPLFRRWIMFCYSLGDLIITPTEYSRGLLTGYGIRKPIVAMSNGIDTGYFHPDKRCRASFRRRYGLDDNDRVVISVGHYIQRKGLPEFVELARKMPDVHFFWFGHTSLELVPRQIREAVENTPANVSFPGYVGREEMREAYCGCDLFSFMSHDETEGIVVLEALACGTPTIVRDIPVYAGWLRDGENVYKAENDEDFAVKAQAVLDRKLPSLSDAGRDTALERSFGNIAEKLRCCCEELLDKEEEFTEDAAGQHV